MDLINNFNLLYFRMEDIEGNITSMEIDLPIPEIFELRMKERSKSEA